MTDHARDVQSRVTSAVVGSQHRAALERLPRPPYYPLDVGRDGPRMIRLTEEWRPAPGATRSGALDEAHARMCEDLGLEAEQVQVVGFQTSVDDLRPPDPFPPATYHCLLAVSVTPPRTTTLSGAIALYAVSGTTDADLHRYWQRRQVIRRFKQAIRDKHGPPPSAQKIMGFSFGPEALNRGTPAGW